MSRVKNEPKYKNGLLQAIRAQMEHRAFWLYLLWWDYPAPWWRNIMRHARQWDSAQEYGATCLRIYKNSPMRKPMRWEPLR